MDINIDGIVPDTRTVNGHALSADVTVTATDVDALKRDGSNANSDVDLGSYALNSKSVKINGTGGNGHLGLKHQSADATASASETVIFAGSDGEPRYKNDGGTVAQFASRAWVTAQGYITNVITALGYTPVPTTRTINGLDLTTNRTLTASDVSAVASNGAITGATKTKITYDSKGLVTNGDDATTADIADSTNKRYVTDAQLTVIGNTSGTNTGDETQSSILSKLGWFAYNRTAESTSVTGTTSETIIENIQINANTFVSGGVLRSYNNKFRKVGSAGSLTVRMYISPNNNNLTGATQIAILAVTSANLFSELLRTFTATTTSLIGFNSSISAANDTTVSTAARTETSVSWNSNQYFIITVQLTSSADSVTMIGASLKNF